MSPRADGGTTAVRGRFSEETCEKIRKALDEVALIVYNILRYTYLPLARRKGPDMTEHQPHTPPPPPEAPTPDHGRSLLIKNLIPILLVLVALAVFAISLNEPVKMTMSRFADILSPVLIGGVIAYLCNPILVFFDHRVFRRLKRGGIRRGLSLLCTVLVSLGVLVLIGLSVIPQIYRSLSDFVANIGVYVENLKGWLQDLLDRAPVTVDLDAWIGDTENILRGLLDKLAPLMTGGNLADKLIGMVMGLFNTFKNVLLGMVIAFYILASKEKRIAQVRKARAALLNEKQDKKLSELVTLADDTFGGFIYGKLLDSLVIGILTFAMLTIFDISEYNLLIAIIVGITNIIPVFGPFIGAIPSFFVVLISKPTHAVLFLVLIFIIQQLDGNVIGPKILGDNTGVSSLCVIVAISICSTLWGVAGMIIGVPVFAVIIELFRRLLEDRLAAQGAPTDTADYYPSDAVGNAEAEVHYEHSHLRYVYSNSRLKPKLDRIRHKLFSVSLRKEKPLKETPPPEAPPSDNGDAT